MKKLFVRDIQSLAKGARIEAEFVVRGVQFCPRRTGGGYLALELADTTGCVRAKWWDRHEGHARALEAVRYGLVQGRVDDYQQTRSIIVTGIDDVGVPDDLADFEAVAALPLAELTRRFEAHVASIRNPHLASLLAQVFGEPELRRRFYEAPAAMSNHHACRHGLLQHTLEVTDLAVAVADLQKTWGYERSAERDLVVTGSLLHDIGKVRELTWGDDGNGYTRCGNLLGHITLGTHLIVSKMGKVPGFPPLLREALIHIVVSHHGKLEWGSAVVPMMPEAQIVHTADLLDAQLFYMQEAESEASGEFARQRKLDDRRVFVRPEEIAPAGPSPSVAVPLSLPDTGAWTSRPTLPVLRFAAAGGPKPDVTFDTRRLPLLGSVAAGPPLAAEQSVEERIDVEAVGLPSDPQIFLLRVRGDSMAGDGIADGDLVVVRPQEHHEPEDIVVALLRGDNEVAIKRVETREGGVFLVSSNPGFAPIHVPDPEDLQVRGRVVARLQPVAAAQKGDGE